MLELLKMLVAVVWIGCVGVVALHRTDATVESGRLSCAGGTVVGGYTLEDA